MFGLKQIGKVGNQTTYGWEVTHKADPVADDKNLETFAAVVKSMPTDAPCFVVFDFVDTKSDGRQIKKLLLIKWCPDSVNFRIKPVIGASYQTLKCVATRGGVARFTVTRAHALTHLHPPPHLQGEAARPGQGHPGDGLGGLAV